MVVILGCVESQRAGTTNIKYQGIINDQEEEQAIMKNAGKYEQDLDEIDFNNYRGIYFEDEPGRKYQDPDTGAHFNFKDMYQRLQPYSEKQRMRQDMEAQRMGSERAAQLQYQLQQQTQEIQRIFTERQRKGSRSKSKGQPGVQPQVIQPDLSNAQGYTSADSPFKRMTFGKENLTAQLQSSQPFNIDEHQQKLVSMQQAIREEAETSQGRLSTGRSGGLGPAEIQKLKKQMAFGSTGSRNIAPPAPGVTKVKQYSTDESLPNTQPRSSGKGMQLLAMQGAGRNHGGTRNTIIQPHSLSMDQQQKPNRMLSYQLHHLNINDISGNRQKTPQSMGKKGTRPLIDGQSGSKLGNTSLERKTYDGAINLTQGSTEMKKGDGSGGNYSSTQSNRKSVMGRTGSGNVGEAPSKNMNYMSFYANRRKPTGSSYLQQGNKETNRSQSGKYSIGGMGVTSGGSVGNTASFGVKPVAKKPSKAYLRKNGPAITSLNLQLYGSSGKSRNSVHSKHINSLQNYSANHQQQLLSLENRFSSSTLKNANEFPSSGASIKSPQRMANRKLVQIPSHQLTSGPNYFMQAPTSQSRNTGLSLNQHSSGMSGGGSVGAVTASGRKKLGSYIYEPKKTGSILAQQRRSEQMKNPTYMKGAYTRVMGSSAAGKYDSRQGQ